MSRLLDHLSRIEEWVISGLAGGTLLLACYSMASRYLFPSGSLDWASEVIVYVMGWIVLLAAARLISRDGHIRVDVLVGNLGSRARRLLLLFSALFGIVVTVLLTWSGVLVVLDALRWGETSSSSLRVPMWIYFLCLPAGGAIMTMRLVAVAWSLARPGSAGSPRSRGLLAGSTGKASSDDRAIT
ncbi:MAG: transporter [Alphaproteobacteria bacterium]|nr:MAG: transporter [Alphaproteobacteria bacterium]